MNSQLIQLIWKFVERITVTTVFDKIIIIGLALVAALKWFDNHHGVTITIAIADLMIIYAFTTQTGKFIAHWLDENFDQILSKGSARNNCPIC